MATHHWIIICGIKHHVQVGDYSGVRESGPHKRDEDGDDDEDDHRGIDPLPMALRRHRVRAGEVLPLVLPPPWPPPGWGEVPSLVLSLHGDDGPSQILPHGLW